VQQKPVCSAARQACKAHAQLGFEAVPASGKSPEQVKRDEVLRERNIEQRLQRLIVRAKGIVSEEMLVRHQREIPVDEIPDYAVTHLLAQLGERELQLARY